MKKIIIFSVIIVALLFVGIEFKTQTLKEEGTTYYSSGATKQEIKNDKEGNVEQIINYWPNGNWEYVDVYKEGIPYERKYFLPEQDLNGENGEKTSYYMTKKLDKEGNVGKVTDQTAYPEVEETQVVSWNIKLGGFPVPYIGTAGMRDYEIAQALYNYYANSNMGIALLQEVGDGSNGNTNQFEYLQKFSSLSNFSYIHYDGNTNVIMFDNDKFSLVEKGAFELETQAQGDGTRYLTWGVLKDKQSEEELLVGDIHLSIDDTVADDQLEEALRYVDTLKSEYSYVDNIIIGGDFNIETMEGKFKNNAKKKLGDYGYVCTNFNESTKTLNDDGEIDHICTYKDATIKEQVLESTPYDDSNNLETQRIIEQGISDGKKGFDKEDVTDEYYASDHRPVRANIVYSHV